MKYELEKTAYGWRVANPPTNNELSQYYADKYFQNPSTQYKLSYSDEELKYNASLARMHLDWAEELGVAEGSVLDLGCGEGFFLKEAAARGFEIAGSDFSSFGFTHQNPETLEKTDFRAGDFVNNDLFGGELFDLVVCHNVIEHVIDPHRALERIGEYVSPNGVAIVLVPNDWGRFHEVILAGTAKEESRMFAPPDHLHYFNAATFHKYIESCGYSVEDAISDYPIDQFLLDDRLNYYKVDGIGPAAHAVRMRFHIYLDGLPVSAKLGLLRAQYKAEIGRDIAVAFTKG